MRIPFFAAFAAALLTSAAACGPPATSGRGSTVVIGEATDIQTWNPYLSESLFTDEVLNLLYPSLFVEQVDYREHPPSFAPHLATSWALSDDGLELLLELHPEATWDDGAPVTADDVVFSWLAATSPEVGWPDGVLKDRIASVEAVDAKTVRVRYTRRYPYQLMDLNDGAIVPAHAWSDVPFDRWRDEDWLARRRSAGPFRFRSHTPQQEVVLERNPTYFATGLPRVEQVVWRVVPSRAALLTQLLAGGIDLMKSVPPTDADRVRRHPELELVEVDDRSYTHLCWNLRRPPLDDVRVRRALALAVDRQALVDAVYRGAARIGVGPVLSTMWAFDDSLEPLPFDPAAARQLLAEAGFVDRDGDGVLEREGRPLTLELLANSEDEARRDLLLMISADLGRIGVLAEPRLVEWGTLLALRDAGNFDAFVNRWVEPTQVDLGEVWRSAAPGEPSLNFGGFASAEVDELLDLVDELDDFAAQKPLLDRIQRLIVEQQPYAFLVENKRLVGLSRRVEGAVVNDASPYFNLAEWSLAAAPR